MKDCQTFALSGFYGHGTDLCSKDVTTTSVVKDGACLVLEKSSLKRKVEEEPFGP